jgi:hypothetical protein
MFSHYITIFSQFNFILFQIQEEKYYILGYSIYWKLKCPTRDILFKIISTIQQSSVSLNLKISLLEI